MTLVVAWKGKIYADTLKSSNDGTEIDTKIQTYNDWSWTGAGTTNARDVIAQQWIGMISTDEDGCDNITDVEVYIAPDLSPDDTQVWVWHRFDTGEGSATLRHLSYDPKTHRITARYVPWHTFDRNPQLLGSGWPEFDLLRKVYRDHGISFEIVGAIPWVMKRVAAYHTGINPIIEGVDLESNRWYSELTCAGEGMTSLFDYDLERNLNTNLRQERVQ